MTFNSKWTAADVPDQSGRVAVITGANTGIGYETALLLACKGAHVVLAVRNVDKGRAAADRIAQQTPHADVAVRELDLTSLDSVRQAADAMRADYPRIDLLINNAGVMMTPKGLTRDGFELQFGTNHLGHFALTGHLIDNLLPVPGARVVTVSSWGHYFGRIKFDDLQSERRYSPILAYGQSKLANLLFTYELNRRLAASGAPTVALAAHPGGSKTELTRNLWSPVRKPIELVWGGLLAQSPEMGALPTMRAATAPEAHGANYFGPDGIVGQRGYPTLVSSSRRSHDEVAQRRLWQVSEHLTGITYPV